MKESLVLSRKNGLYLNLVPGKGRGVFCNEFIAVGEVIEITPAYMIDEEDRENIRRTDLKHYVFHAGDEFSPQVYLWSDTKHGPKTPCLVMGITSLCNHLLDSNATWNYTEDRGMPFFTLKARRDIPPHTEICVNYGATWMHTHKDTMKR
jgi:hypothetical protein